MFNFAKANVITVEMKTAKSSATNVLGLRPQLIGPEKAAATYDTAVELAVTSGRKGCWLALDKDGNIILASRPTIKRHGWQRLGRITTTAAPRHSVQ